MTGNDERVLSRRTVLGGIGAVGLASAGAGLGTSAYFNDTESFSGNTLTAGKLDLKVDWQQTYFGASESSEFVNAHPDHDGDGEQSIVVDDVVHAYSDDDRNVVDYLTCANLDESYEADFGDQDHLVSLSDVKPGDWGEVTFSLHLCDNPAYLWMQAANVAESGGANPEPEQVAEGDAENSADLADAIDVRMWYDEDCDNRLNRADIMLTIDVSGSMLYEKYGGLVNQNNILSHSETTRIDLVEAGAKNLIAELQNADADVQVGVVFFDGSSDGTPHLQLGAGLTDDLSSLVASGGALDDLRSTLASIVGASTTNPYADVDIATGTYLGEGIDLAQQELAANGRPSVRAIDLVLSDGNSFRGGDNNPYSSPTDAADDARAASPSPATDVYTVAIGGGANDTVMQSMAGAAGSSGNDASYFRDVPSATMLPATFQGLAGTFTSEVVFFEGSLREALDTLSTGDGVALDGERMTPTYVECFDAEEDICLGFEWTLPPEVGNEVQGDSVAFDLVFYAEQCRHNAGPNAA